MNPLFRLSVVKAGAGDFLFQQIRLKGELDSRANQKQTGGCQEADGWGKKTLQRLAADLKNDYSEIKGFTVRNMQYMVQFFNEYNQELMMIKRAASPNAKSLISHLDEYNFTLPIKHLDWTHNLVLIKQVKDIRARYWYMVHRLHDVLALTGQCKSNDRTFGLKRPHVWTAMTGQCKSNDRTIQLQRALQFLSVFTGGIAGYLLELMIEMGETVVAAVVCHLADIDVFVDQQFGCV